jgi:hypothetical protein
MRTRTKVLYAIAVCLFVGFVYLVLADIILES